MNNLIDWDFAPKRTSKGTKGCDASIYWNPNKKSPTYTIQLHKSAPKRLIDAEIVSIGRLNDSIVISDSDNGNIYNVMKKGQQGTAQINGKELSKKLVEFFGYDAKFNHKIRMKLNPIGSKSLRLWEIEIINNDSENN